MIRLFKHYVPKSLLYLGVIESLLLMGSIEAAVHIRSFQAGINPGPLMVRIPEILTYVVVLYVTMLSVGLYRSVTARDPKLSFLRLAIAQFLALFVMSLIFFAFPDVAIWRSIIIIALPLAFIMIMIVRAFFVRVTDLNRFRRRILVVGAGDRAKRLLEFQKNAEGAGFEILGCVSPDSEKAKIDNALCGEAVGPLPDYVEQNDIDEIVLALEERRGALPIHDLLTCKIKGVKVSDFATFFERERGYVDIDTLQPSWLVFSDGFLGGKLWEQIFKRLFDISASLAVLVFTLPILLVTALAVRFTSKGPVLYRQERVGRLGKTYHVLKFRSMRTDAEKDGVPQWADEDDPRVTKVGKIIRASRIDEIPQIFNVLKGDMSFVGPRPERPYFVDSLAAQIPFYNERHHVKPGITGWAQINHPYGASVEDAKSKLEYDLYYIKNYTIFLDFLILIQTARVVLWPDGVR